MAESRYIFLIATPDYDKSTLLIRQLKEAGFACKIEQKGSKNDGKIFEIHVHDTDYTQAQEHLFGERYEPDYEGNYEKIGQLNSRLRKQLTICGIGFFIGFILQFIKGENRDLEVIAFVGFGIGIWYLAEIYKTVRQLYFPGKQKNQTENQQS